MKIFIDIDGVLWNTAKSIVNLYNRQYGHDGNWEEAIEWNFSPAIPDGTPESVIDKLFASHEIYEGDDTIEGAVEFINKLNNEFDNVYFCTVGKNINNSQKLKMLKRIVPNVKVITISFPNEVLADKSMINMDGSIFIDDHSKNLKSSNAKYKILFEPYGRKNWNIGFNGFKLNSWEEVYNFVKTIHMIEEKNLAQYLHLVNFEDIQDNNKILEEILKMSKEN